MGVGVFFGQNFYKFDHITITTKGVAMTFNFTNTNQDISQNHSDTNVDDICFTLSKVLEDQPKMDTDLRSELESLIALLDSDTYELVRTKSIHSQPIHPDTLPRYTFGNLDQIQMIYVEATRPSNP